MISTKTIRFKNKDWKKETVFLVMETFLLINNLPSDVNCTTEIVIRFIGLVVVLVFSNMQLSEHSFTNSQRIPIDINKL
jgi:hypothetical protein